MNRLFLNKSKASLRRAEYSKMRGEAPNYSTTESQVTKCVRTEFINPKLLNVLYKTFLGSVDIYIKFRQRAETI